MKILTSTFALVLLLFCFTCIAVTNSDGVQSQTNQKALLNYITKAFLPDGESEIRMRFGDEIVREASITKENEAGVRTGLILRQLASGPHLLQLIYKVGEGKASGREIMTLLECEMINEWGAADQFRNHFREDLRRAGVNLEVPPNHLDFLKSQNGDSTVDDLESLEEMGLSEDVFDLDQGLDEFRNVSVRALRNDEVIGELQHSFDMIAQQRQCRRLHKKMKKAAGHNKNGLAEDTSNGYDDSDSESHKLSSRVRAHRGLRKKRELSSNFQFPGTKWCGKGYSTNDSNDLGGFTGTDKCCRMHDLGCPFYIEAFEEKYAIFNWRGYTINHCTCDERFRSCLKQTNTGSSNFVGKLFFNVVQTKCFVLKPEKHCAKRSWFGKCVKFEYRKQAHLRDPTPY
ncbi:unnamed protein product [Orchesella dallaii]|uniref:phospholipase A2 n=1 Tax=Orchesella dallaii TaxID=48710 RepID=A0ABP1QZN1_9HEXA